MTRMTTNRVLISQQEIQQRIKTLAAEIERDYPEGAEIHLVGVLKGGFMFMADLVRAMATGVTLDFVALSSYGKRTTSSGEVRTDARVLAGHLQAASAANDPYGLPAEQAFTAEGGRPHRLHRLHDRGSFRRGLRPRLRRRIPQPPIHRGAAAVRSDQARRASHSSGRLRNGGNDALLRQAKERAARAKWSGLSRPRNGASQPGCRGPRRSKKGAGGTGGAKPPGQQQEGA